MDYHNLNDLEVREIIKKLKYPQKLLSFQDIKTQVSSLFGRIDLDEVVIDGDDVRYVLHIFRGQRNPNRFSIHLRFKEFHDNIVRVDINPSNKHLNPDGNVVSGNHIHIYSNKYAQRDKIAIPLEESDFPNVNLISDVFLEFINYTNIQEEEIQIE
ncbi:DUF6978 family protein [Streptococcus halichoeri]|uniref:DUF6978 family protein n=1 Tax=Streptococcus halichoeri TaxID=254785 RepID=UPI00135A4F22|nr:hypothetical protein [Streptococcus halichoeri]